MGPERVSIPSDTPHGETLLFAHRGGDISPTGIPFRISRLPTQFESEPNDVSDPLLNVPIPHAVEGTIDPPGDVDYFTFEGRKGDSLTLRVFATKFGSSLDSRLIVVGPSGQAIIWEDDNVGLDSEGRCTIPADGTYQVIVFDHRRRGGSNFPYRIEIQPTRPALDVDLEVDYPNFQPPALAAYRGNRTVMVARVHRTNFEGPVRVLLPNLPEGVSAEIPDLPASEDLVPILFSTEKESPLSGARVAFEAVSEVERRAVLGGLQHTIKLAVGRNYNPYLTKTIDRMTVAVAEEAPFRIEVVEPRVEIQRGGSSTLRVRAIRGDGFDEPILLCAPWSPLGIACGSPVLLSGSSEMEVEIAASDEVLPGNRRMILVGKYSDYTIASNFFDIQILESPTRTEAIFPHPSEMAGAAVESVMATPPSISAVVLESTETMEMPLEEVVQENHRLSKPVASQLSDDVTPTVSFRYQILPMLTKFGCNTAACHGHKMENVPFHLSVFGHDPVSDLRNLRGEDSDPRIIPGFPDESLVLLKSSGQADHGGGEILSPGSPPYQLLKTWIEEGARADPLESPGVERLEISPSYVVLPVKGATRRFSLWAVFSDGSRLEVSDLGSFTVTHPAGLAIDESGLVTAKGPGEATVLGRYGNRSACAKVVCRPDYQETALHKIPGTNYIDDRVFEKLRLLRVPPADRCDDHEFLRRVYLDLIGVPPTVQETRAFLDDSHSDKRTRLIDRLLARPEFSDVWATKWSDVLHVRSFDAIDRKAMIRYSNWIRDSMAAGATPAKLATDILSADGGAFDSPATNFYKPDTPPEEVAEDFAQVFLGIRIQCAKCHDHPFDRWTMDDYYSFAAFFGRTFRKTSEDRRQALVYSDIHYGEIKHPKTDEAMAPKFLGGIRPETEGLDRRAVLADWIVSGTNPWFARNVANRVWEHFFGVGLVAPVDDFRESNPPTHPELLDELAQRLIDSDYDIQPLIRDIAGSTVYQLSCLPRDPKNHDVRNYSHFPIRRLDAEVLADSLAAIGEQEIKFPHYPLGFRAMELPNGNSESHFLTAFGRPPRVTVCAEDRQRQPTLSQGLALMNGEIIQQVCSSSEGRLNRLLRSEKTDAEILSEIYLASFSRPPSEEETRTHCEYVAMAEDRNQAFEDILWAVLNSKEFLFQH